MDDQQDRDALLMIGGVLPMCALSALGCAGELPEWSEQNASALQLGPLDTYENCVGSGSGDGEPVSSCSLGPGCGGGLTGAQLPELSYSFNAKLAELELSAKFSGEKERGRCYESAWAQGEGGLKVCLLGQCEAVGVAGSGDKELIEGVECDGKSIDYQCTQEKNFCDRADRSVSAWYERSLEIDKVKDLGLPIELSASVGFRAGVSLQQGHSKGSPPEQTPEGPVPTAAAGCCPDGRQTQSKLVSVGGVGFISGTAKVEVGPLSVDLAAQGKLCIRQALQHATQCDGTSSYQMLPPAAFVGITLTPTASTGPVSVSNDQICTPWGWCFSIEPIGLGNPDACDLDPIALGGALGSEDTSQFQGDSTWTPPGPEWSAPNGAGGATGGGGSGSGGWGSGGSGGGWGSGGWGSGGWGSGGWGSGGWGGSGSGSGDQGGAAPPGDPESWNGTLPPTSEEPVVGAAPVAGCTLYREIRACNGGLGREIVLRACGTEIGFGCSERLIYDDHQYIPALGGTMVCQAEAPHVGAFVAGNLTCRFLPSGAGAYAGPFTRQQTTLRDICATPSGATVIYTPGTVFAQTDGRERCFSTHFNGLAWSEGPAGRCSCEQL